MIRSLQKAIILFSLSTFFGSSLLAQSEAESKQRSKEFIMSCTYGVLTGTLVGAASLAFTESPGENLNRIARGASLGLYAGIALGIYVAYYVPDGDEIPLDDGLAPLEGEELSSQWMILPSFNSNNKLDGAYFQLSTSLPSFF
ncbi:MAG: hypothetical protein AB8E15_13165 [Bdellovibrionales bacterium]